jgi:hypothetical protein
MDLEKIGIKPMTEIWVWPSFFLFGPPGSGKTTLVAEIAEHLEKKTLILDLDDKIIGQTNITTAQRAKMDVWTPPDPYQSLTDQIKPAIPPKTRNYTAFVETLNKLGSIPTTEFPYDAVAIDTYTTLDEFRIQHLMNINNAVSMEFSHWMANKRSWILLSRSFRSLPCMTFFLGHVIHEKDEVTGKMTSLPSIAGGFREVAQKDFAEVFYLQGAEDGKRMSALTLTGPRYSARSGLPGIKHPEDTLENIKKCILEYVKRRPRQ